MSFFFSFSLLYVFSQQVFLEYMTGRSIASHGAFTHHQVFDKRQHLGYLCYTNPVPTYATMH